MAEIISFDTGLTINMCEPTAAQRMCIHYALDACHGDCDRCPGAELLAEKKAKTAADARLAKHITETNRLWAVMLVCLFGALGMIGFLAAADWGLSRTEHSYQISRV